MSRASWRVVEVSVQNMMGSLEGLGRVVESLDGEVKAAGMVKGRWEGGCGEEEDGVCEDGVCDGSGWKTEVDGRREFVRGVWGWRTIAVSSFGGIEFEGRDMDSSSSSADSTPLECPARRR